MILTRGDESRLKSFVDTAACKKIGSVLNWYQIQKVRKKEKLKAKPLAKVNSAQGVSALLLCLFSLRSSSRRRVPSVSHGFDLPRRRSSIAVPAVLIVSRRCRTAVLVLQLYVLQVRCG
jgi:hypothetical protein